MREVVFDIGNVLLRWDPRNLFARVFDDRAAMELFLEQALPMSFIADTDIAQDFAEMIEARVRAFPAFARQLRLFDTRWAETLGAPIEDNVALLRRLKARGARVHALSNFAHEKFALAATMHPFLRKFDVAVISGHVGVAKPDPRIYEILRERTGACDLLFVDDSPRNVEAARTCGIEAIHYAPGVDLASELARRGLL